MSFFSCSSGIIINGGIFMSNSLPTQDSAGGTQVLRKRKDRDRDSCEPDDYAQADDLRKRRRCSSLDGLMIVKADEVDLHRELIRGIGYRIHSASHRGRLVAFKAFEGPRAKQDWKVDVALSKKFLHSNVLKIEGVSDERSESHFVLFRGMTSEQKMESLIAKALRTDLNMSVQISMKAVKGIAAGLSYLKSQNIPMYSGTMNNDRKWENFNIFTGHDDEPIISFDPSGTVYENGSVLRTCENEIDGCGVEVLSGVCQQLFSGANSVLYDDSPEREWDMYDREGFPRAPLDDTEGASNVSESVDTNISNPSNSMEKPKSSRTPRREVWWRDLGAKNQSLESIKRRFEDCLERFLSSSSKSLLPHITSAMDSRLRHNLHQCPGYLREEITLASDVSKSVIISHAFPSQSEVCSICGQLVQYISTEPSIVDGERQEAPLYPSQDNMASLSSSSSMEDASNISEIQPEAYGYSASHSGSPTQSGALDTEDSVRVFTHLATFIHHIHNDHIGVHNSSNTCGWTTCGRRGLLQSSRFALISHVRSHTGEKPAPKSERYFGNIIAKSRRSSPEPENSVFFFQGQGGRTALPPITDMFPTIRFPVAEFYSSPYTQPRSAANKIGYDINPQAYYNPYQPTGTSLQFRPPFVNYEIHERYSPQPLASYPTYPSRSTPPIVHNPANSRRLPPLTTSPTSTVERWRQPSLAQPAIAFTGNSIRSPTASYPPAYVTYSTNSANAYSYHIPHDHASSIHGSSRSHGDV